MARAVLATLLLALVCALPLGASMVARAAWTGPFNAARCLGPVCLITSPFVEVSIGEYDPPLPAGATVPANGAPSWGGPATATSGGTTAAP